MIDGGWDEGRPSSPEQRVGSRLIEWSPEKLPRVREADPYELDRILLSHVCAKSRSVRGGPGGCRELTSS